MTTVSIRTRYFSYVDELEEGDQLADGSLVTEGPRPIGENFVIRLKFCGKEYYLELPCRLPIALKHADQMSESEAGMLPILLNR